MTTLWLTPEYPFRVPKLGSPNVLQEIVVDVTLSAPTFAQPSKAMKEVFRRLETDYLKGKAKILDFGAAKLRNTLYLWTKGHKVFPVEFPKVFQTEQGREVEKKAQKFANRCGRLRLLLYPNEFRTWPGKVDLALLINVLNIMPVPAERDIVLQECHDKLKAGGYLLWYSQYGDLSYKRRCTDDVRLGDGFFIGTRRLYKTFYREFSLPEMDSMMLGHGFDFVQSYPVPNNHVRLYKKADANPLRRVVTRTRVSRELKLDRTIAAPKSSSPALVRKRSGVAVSRPDPPALSLAANLSEGLRRLPKGKAHAGQYVKLVRATFEYVFIPQRLKKIKSERVLFEGRKRVDLFARVGDTGFFASLRQQHGIPAPYVHIECKNYKEDIGNPEFDQLKGRLSAKKGQFGLLVCRQIADVKAIIRRSHDATEADHYVLVITDADLIRLLQLREEGNYEGVDDLFEEKMEVVVL